MHINKYTHLIHPFNNQYNQDKTFASPLKFVSHTLLWLQATTDFFSVSIDYLWLFQNFIQMESYIVYCFVSGFFFLVYHLQNLARFLYAPVIFPSYCWVVCHCMAISQFVYPLICWWTFVLFQWGLLYFLKAIISICL